MSSNYQEIQVHAMGSVDPCLQDEDEAKDEDNNLSSSFSLVTWIDRYETRRGMNTMYCLF